MRRSPFPRDRIVLLLCSVLATGSLFVFSSVASADNCPNAVFRNGPSSRLPDCRAYEMVTPPYKEGYPVSMLPLSASPPFSTDGFRVEGQSIGVFAGAEDSLVELHDNYSSSGAFYLFTRGGSGWATTAISPPASQYPDAGSPFSTSDLSESLWVAATSAQINRFDETSHHSPAKGLYVRSLDGPLMEVGPILPPSVNPDTLEREYFTFLGASSDGLSAVLYSMTEARWPGDLTKPGAESLYEYAGTGSSEPLLVGVSGDAGSTSLISTCGTRFNRVSQDAVRVLFTALACGSSPGVQEVYARIDNARSDANTVSISEPSEEDCSECETAEGVRGSASFVGSSADASKVFFTTKQPLLGGDLTNNLYEYDFQGEVGHRIVRDSGGDSTVSSPAANVESVVNASPDGTHVLFYASGVLTKTPDGLGQEAQAGKSNLYLYERDAQYPNGRTVFVLPRTDAPGVSSVSQNGRFVAFQSNAHLTSDDFGTVAQTFEYDSQTGILVRVSVGQDGYNQNGNTGSVGNLFVANDGAAFFESVNPLAPQAVSGTSNVYEYRGGEVNLISDGQDTRGGSLSYVSPSGTDVFFTTYDRLLPQDTDVQFDTYDARAGGGFPEAPAPRPCEGDACQGPLSGAPVLLSPGSMFQAGGENAAPATVAVPLSKALKSKARARKPTKKRKGKARKRKRKAGKSSSLRHRGRGIGGGS